MRILLLTLSLIAAPAFANGKHDRNSHGDSDSTSISESASISESVSSVGDITVENVFQPPAGASTFSDGAIRVNPAVSSGDVITGDQSVEIINPDDIKIRNTPDARAPFSNSTSPCIVGFSAGVSVPGFGGSVGKGLEDMECTRRQSAQTWSNMGVPAMGLWLMCRSKDMERAGVEPENCDAMVAQMQIEAELVAPEVAPSAGK